MALVCFAALSRTTDELADEYITKYSAIAVQQMQQKGIPASITLAQGLLESGFGQGTLAVKANNHFGIKCHSDWKGPSIRKDDDAKNECFRKYRTAVQSYIDHSDFLRYKSRYAGLFELEITDYKSWAYGLKAAGYATDPKYPEKLISFIERYDLARFDKPHPDREALPTPAMLERPQRFTSSGRKGTFALSLSREILKINGVAFVYARNGETYATIAAQYDMFLSEILRYNDEKQDRTLLTGDIVYLRRKASQAAKGLDKHVCGAQDNLYSVSQKYGIRLRALMRLNSIDDPEYVLREDDTIVLRRNK